MRKNIWKKTAAGLMALLIVAGTSPVIPVTKNAEKSAITAYADGDVLYLDANGNMVRWNQGEYTILTQEYLNEKLSNDYYSLDGGNYIVNGDITIDNCLQFQGNAKLLLADGVELKSTVTSDYAILAEESLEIYGQSAGTGTLTTSNGRYSLTVKGNLTINGGTINANGLSKGINANNVVLNGGIVNAQSYNYGIYASNDIVLNGAAITASRYSANYGNVKVGGNSYTDGKNNYAANSALSYDEISALEGKTVFRKGSPYYIDENGKPAMMQNVTELTQNYFNSDAYYTLAGGNYVVSENITLDKQLKFTGATKLILSDGAELKSTYTDDNPIIVTGTTSASIDIYGQSTGTGKLTTSENGKPINVDGNLTINGGTINANSGVISGNGDITINGGTINAKCQKSGIEGYNVVLNGGIVNAQGSEYGIGAINVTLNGAVVTASSYYSDPIYAKSTIKVGDKAYSDGTKEYEANSTLNTEQIAALAGKTVFRKGSPFYIDENGKHAMMKNVTELTLDYLKDKVVGSQYFGDIYELPGGNYIVNEDITLDKMLFFNGEVKLILADGAELKSTVENGLSAVYVFGAFDIYGQSAGTGTLSTSENGQGIEIDIGDFKINGGIINANGNVVGIKAMHNVILNGGIINSKGSIISSTEDIVLDGAVVTASYYIVYDERSVKVGDNTYTDGMNEYEANTILTATQIDTLKRKTIYPKGTAPYIDEKGKLALMNDVTVLTQEYFTQVPVNNNGEYVLPGENYVVKGEIILDKQLDFIGNTKLILADGAKLESTVEDKYAISVDESLDIYGQSAETGSLATSEKGLGILADENITINGGTINAQGYSGINAKNGNLTINGGIVNAQGSGYGIYANNVALNGGIINAQGVVYGIYADNVVMNGTVVTANTYSTSNGKIKIANGKAYIDDDGNTYTGTLNAGEIADKTLSPAYKVTFHLNNNGDDIIKGVAKTGEAYVTSPDVALENKELVSWCTDEGLTTVFDFETPIIADIELYAKWVDLYTVTWKNGDATLETDPEVPYGTMPEYNGATPTKAADSSYTYTFSGWSDGTNTYSPEDLPEVTVDVTYTAQFTRHAKYVAPSYYSQTWTMTMKDYEYDGTAHEPTIDGTMYGDVTYTYYNADTGEQLSGAPSAVGNYKVVVYAEGGPKYYSRTRIANYSITAPSAYTVTVKNGKISGKTSGKFTPNAIIAAKADAPKSGKRFGFWKKNGVTVSYNSTYTYKMSTGNVELEAVYLDADDVFDLSGNCVEDAVVIDKTNRKITFTFLNTIPEGCTIVKAGIVATSDMTKANTLSVDNADYNRFKENITVHNYQYKWTKTNVQDGQAWYVKGYQIYKDKNGTEHIVYSNLQKATLNGYQTIHEDRIVGTALMDTVTCDKVNSKLTFAAMMNVPADCTIKWAGVAATSDKSKVDQLTKITATEKTMVNGCYVRGMTTTKHTVLYSWTKTQVTASETWYVVPYLIYTDSLGTERVVYGELTTAKYNS